MVFFIQSNTKSDRKMTKRMTNKQNKGFTLAELLIVVAVIAVLVAVAVPLFTSALEKSREATDLANIRSAYAQVMADAITDSMNEHTIEVNLKQKQDEWQTPDAQGTLNSLTGNHVTGTPTASGKATVKWNPDGYAEIVLDGSGGSGSSGVSYITGNTRPEILGGSAQALGEIFTELLAGPNAQKVKDWTRHTESGRNDGIKYKEISLSDLMDPSKEMYRDASNTSFKWRQYMLEKGIDDSVLTTELIGSVGKQSYIFLGEDFQPCAIGYYKEGDSGKYRIKYLTGEHAGETWEWNSIGDRHLRVYNFEGADTGTRVE